MLKSEFTVYYPYRESELTLFRQVWEFCTEPAVCDYRPKFTFDETQMDFASLDPAEADYIESLFYVTLYLFPFGHTVASAMRRGYFTNWRHLLPMFVALGEYDLLIHPQTATIWNNNTDFRLEYLRYIYQKVQSMPTSVVSAEKIISHEIGHLVVGLNQGGNYSLVSVLRSHRFAYGVCVPVDLRQTPEEAMAGPLAEILFNGGTILDFIKQWENPLPHWSLDVQQLQICRLAPSQVAKNAFNILFQDTPRLAKALDLLQRQPLLTINDISAL